MRWSIVTHCIVAALASTVLAQPIPLGGVIQGPISLFANTTYVANGVVEIRGEVVIPQGVTINFPLPQSIIVVGSAGSGTLVVSGSAANPVRFIGQNGGLGGVRFTPQAVGATFSSTGTVTAGSRIDYLEIENFNNAVGAIHVQQSSPLISHCVIRNSGGAGLRIDNTNGIRVVDVVIDNCGTEGIIASSCTASSLDRVRVYGASSWGCHLTQCHQTAMTACDFSRNHGGLYAYGCNSVTTASMTIAANNGNPGILAESTTSMLIDGAVVAKNHAVGSGGGMRIESGNALVIRDSLFLENTASVAGGGLFVNGPTTVLSTSAGPSTFIDNHSLGSGPFRGDDVYIALSFAAGPDVEATGTCFGSIASRTLHRIYDHAVDSTRARFIESPAAQCAGVWRDIHGGIMGSAGIPILSGLGNINGSTTTLTLSNAAPNSPGLFAYSVALEYSMLAPLSLVAVPGYEPPAQLVLITTDAAGSWGTAASIPPGLAYPFRVVTQVAVFDATSPNRVASLSNALVSYL